MKKTVISLVAMSMVFLIPLHSLTIINLSATTPLTKTSKEAQQQSSHNAIAQPTPITDIFSDANLAEAVRNNLHKQSIDALVKQHELDRMQSLTYAFPQDGQKIQALTGIQYLRNMKELDFSGNDVSDLSDLSTMEQLTKLVVTENAIKDLAPISRLINLTHLDVSKNHIFDLTPLEFLTNLSVLVLDNQTIEDYALSAGRNSNITFALCRARNVNGKIIEGDTYGCGFGPNMFIDDVPREITEEVEREETWSKAITLGNVTSVFSGTASITVYPKRRIRDIFPDPVLAEVIRAKLNSLASDETAHKASVDDWVTGHEILGIRELTWVDPPEDQKIKNAEGMGRLFLVQNVDFSGNDIADLAGFFGKGPRTLTLRGNKIKDVSPLIGFGRISNLDLRDNLIEDLTPFSKLGSTPDKLYLDGNFIQDISSLPKGMWGTIKGTDIPPEVTISLKNQHITEQGLQAVPFTHKNQIRNFDGKLVSPKIISDNGRYEKEQLVWPSLPTDEAQVVNYEWEAKVVFRKWGTARQVRGVFSGRNDITPIKGHTLTFINEGQEYLPPEQTMTGVKIAEPNRPEKEGSTFIGWYTEPVGGKAWDFTADTMPDNDVTLHARFVTNMYTVIFDNGTTEEIYEVAHGSLLAEPERPRQVGKTFIGWFTDPVRGEQWRFATSVLTQDNLKLYARFLVSRYTVMYINERGSAPAAQRLPYGSRVPKPDDPIAEGYRFLGWFTAPLDGRAWDFINDTIGENNVTLYARWEALS